MSPADRGGGAEAGTEIGAEGAEEDGVATDDVVAQPHAPPTAKTASMEEIARLMLRV